MSADVTKSKNAARSMLRKTTLDKDLNKIERIEEVNRTLTRTLVAPGLAAVFLAAVAVLASFHVPSSSGSTVIIIAAAVIGGYMALTIGANDVANNVGPAVGARAMTMTGALIIAAICESAGALIAGGDVVATIAKGIVDPSGIANRDTFVWVMMSALLASAVWVHLATYFGAPVSTTHAIVGGVLGSACVALGFAAVNWSVMGAIAASWVVSPLIGGAIAALFLAFIKFNIIYQTDKIAAARRWVPVLIAIMFAAFGAYLSLKALKAIWHPSSLEVAMIAGAIFVLSLVAARPLIRKQSEGLENRNQSLRVLFRFPLIISAALLSFAHGANDVANAVGPLAAILHGVGEGLPSAKVALPLWVMTIGALGISLGLFLFGPKLIQLVGEKVTKMNPMRAFCVALSAAITVIAASWLGLPVSSTHVAVGAVFGVGFFREYFTAYSKRRRKFVRSAVHRRHASQATALERDELYRRKLVRRSHFTTIVAAWIVTVPAAAGISALFYLAITAFNPV